MKRQLTAKVTSFLTVTLAIIVAPAFAGVPDGVSPGAADRTAEVEGRCPTFIWNPVPGAAFHELVGYRLPKIPESADLSAIDLSDADQVLYAKVPGSAPAWEPELAECLASGGNYVWFVRAIYREEEGEVVEASEWSFGRYFSISSMPSAGEVEEALRVLRRYSGHQVDPEGLKTESADTMRAAPSRRVDVPQQVQKSVASAKTAIKGTVPDTTGETYGVVGISNSPDGAGVAAANSNGGPDLVLDGSAGHQPDTLVSESGIDRPWDTAQTFNIQNSAGAGMTLQENGVEVLTAKKPLDADLLATGLVGPSVGGTGLDTSSAGQGSLLYTNALGTWTTLPPGTSGQVLNVSGGIPGWGAEIDLANGLGTRAFWGGVNSTAGGFLNLYQKDGGIGLELDGDASNNDGGGDVAVYQADGGIGVFLDGESSGAGFVGVRNASGSTRVQLDGESTGTGGRIIVSDASGSTTVDIFGAETDTTGGKINIEDAGSGIRVALDGESIGTGGEISVFDNNGTETVEILGDEAAGGEGSGQILLRNSSGTSRIEIDAEGSSGARIQVLQNDGSSGISLDGQSSEGAMFRIFQDDGDSAIIMEGDSSAGGATGGGRIRVRNAANVSRVFIDGDYNNTGQGRVRADIVFVAGGADLAESFVCKDRSAVKPGMVMSIDPSTPGRLMVAAQAYDRKVAGIVSGAGGVRPGITLSQEGVMEGDHLVALTGRVYCLCDASLGAIQPGDMLTTSDTPGHAMIAADHAKGQGAIIGKAMTSLTDGTGLVLVLVQPQ